jgi:dTDP-glucose 4,6-dehydratase
MSKRILITGVGGFIGSHFFEHVLAKTDWEIIGIDSWKHKGISERITESEYYQKHRGRVKIATHNLNAPLSNFLIDAIGDIDYIINFASQSHVDRSIIDPVPFVENNVSLILNMLEYTKKSKPEKFIPIGTDEVYGATDGVHNHPEWSSIQPSNPYSASKACQEAIAISYWRTYGLPIILTNIMNTFGERQDPEKFVPMVIKKVVNNEEVVIHSDASGVNPGSRFWLHARNTSDALLFILNKVSIKHYPQVDRPERFNIVGERQITNLDIAKMIANILGKELKYKLVDAHSSRPGHDLHYGLSGDKLKEAGYEYPVNLEESMKRTIDWTLANQRWLK